MRPGHLGVYLYDMQNYIHSIITWIHLSWSHLWTSFFSNAVHHLCILNNGVFLSPLLSAMYVC